MAAGQGLVVIEAMKMENELKSPRAGRVLEVAVREGQAVEAGALLARRRLREVTRVPPAQAPRLRARPGRDRVYALWRAPDWGARLVEHLLGRYFKRPVRVEAIALRPATGEIELRGLRVGGATPDAPPFLEVPIVRVRPSLAPLRGNRIVLSRVRVEGLRLRIRAFPSPPARARGRRHPEDRWRRTGEAAGLQVAIQRLVIVGGEFVLNHERVPLDLDLPDFRGRLAGRPEGGSPVTCPSARGS